MLARNAGELNAWVDVVARLPRTAPLSARLVAPCAAREEEEHVPAMRAARAVQRALERAAEAGLPAAWEGFPPCLLERCADLRDEALRLAPVFGPRRACGDLPLEAPEDRVHPLACQECIHRATCPGAPTSVVRNEGDGVLRPARRVRANSFNFERVRRVADFTLRAGACTAMDLRLDPVRNVLLAGSEEVVLYRTPTSDFTEDEIRRVKDVDQQLYLDDHDGAALSDFATGVRRVRLHPQCAACPRRADCCGAVAADPGEAPPQEERWLRDEIARARGRVLDVGCGEQPYREEIRSAIAAGAIDYHGLDPDARALARFREAGVGGTLHLARIEDFEWGGPPFDHVLGIRSVNHFEDVVQAFGVITELLRPGGWPVLCDSPVFAMLRTPQQVAYADTHAPVGHEHYRNWTSHQVVRLLQRFPFSVDAHRPIGEATSNQWTLSLVRTEAAAPD